MRLINRLTMARSRSRLRLPRRTVRFRLTVLYSGLFVVAGIGLLAITYVLVDHSTTSALFVSNKNGERVAVRGTPGGSSSHNPQLKTGTPTLQQLGIARQLAAQATAQHARDLHQLVTQSAIALGVMALLAIVLGWLMAGRVLRPLRTMATATQQITERNLHERLAISGPNDEVKHLADTIDGLLARLENAFQAQRHFVANASHELRTPLTFDRALLEVALADPDASAEDLRSTLEELLASGEQQERLIEALLALASSERGLDRRDHLDLAVVAQRAFLPHRAEAGRQGLQLTTSLGTARLTGNPALVERMVANLIENAVRYNVPEGSIDLRTETNDGSAVLTVANTGLSVSQDDVDRLFQPFQRLGADRTAHPDGLGLGLSIVRAIVAAHGAGLKIRLRPGGGLVVQIYFPLPPVSVNNHRDIAISATGAVDRVIRLRIEEPDPMTGGPRTGSSGGARVSKRT
jgi:signal transduction histidine kinase